MSRKGEGGRRRLSLLRHGFEEEETNLYQKKHKRGVAIFQGEVGKKEGEAPLTGAYSMEDASPREETKNLSGVRNAEKDHYKKGRAKNKK